MIITAFLEAGIAVYLCKDLFPEKERVLSFFKPKPKPPAPLLEIREKGDGRCLIAVRTRADDDWRYMDKDGYEWTERYIHNGYYKNYDEAVAALEIIQKKKEKKKRAEETIKVHVLETT